MRGALGWMGLASAGLACGGELGGALEPDSGVDSAVASDACAPDVAGSWETLGEGYVRTWCTPCHAASLVGDARGGAPVGVDFDGLDDVRRWLDAIEGAATSVSGEAPRMPPGGGPTDADVAAFAAWLACDAPGEAADPDPCAVARIQPGDLTLSSADEVAAFCATFNTVGGALVVATDAPLDCICDVYGDVSIAAPTSSLDAPRLVGVGGSLLLGSPSLRMVRAPSLRTIAGGLNLSGSVDLEGLELPELREVAGDLWADETTGASSLALPELASVGGAVRLVDASVLATVALPRLETVGEELTLSGLSAWAVWDDFASLRTVGGDLSITRNPRLSSLVGLDQLNHVGGDLVLADLASLDSVSGLQDLATVGGGLRIVDDPVLRGVEGFVRLQTVAEALEIARNPLLVAVDGFGSLTRVGVEGDWMFGEHRLAWTDLPALTRAPSMTGLVRVGALEVLRADALDALDFPSLVIVDRQLAVVQVGGLRTLTGLGAVRRVGTDVAITGNPSLPAAAVDAFLASVGEGNIGGAVTVQNNGP